MNSAVKPPQMSSWRETYRQLLFSVGERAPQLRCALLYLLTAAALQGAALACLYPLLQAAFLHQGKPAIGWLLLMPVFMLLASVLRWLGQDLITTAICWQAPMNCAQN